MTLAQQRDEQKLHHVALANDHTLDVLDEPRNRVGSTGVLGHSQAYGSLDRRIKRRGQSRYCRRREERAPMISAQTRAAIPPDITEAGAPKSRATTPASVSPSCGLPMKNTMLTEVMRPRSASGVEICRMVCRRIMLTVSDAPT